MNDGNKKDTSKKKENHESRSQAAVNAGLAGAQNETIQRFGSAVKEHLVAYTGIDNERGEELAKGLKQISESKANNPRYRDINIKQQAGFSAEVKTAARENADKIVNRKNSVRATRTDDMAKQSDGKRGAIGGKNDQLYDIAEVDKRGIYIEGTARQLKFVGGTAEQCADKLLQKGFDKYRDANVRIEVPSDYYEDVKNNLSEKAASIKHQIENAEKSGNTVLVNQKRHSLRELRRRVRT